MENKERIDRMNHLLTQALSPSQLQIIDDSLTIAPLRSAKGKQSYKLPEGHHDYQTLLIHCEKFSKLWSASNWVSIDKGQE